MRAAWTPTLQQLAPAQEPDALTDMQALLRRMVDAYSPASVANILGVNRSTVTLWLKRRRSISPVMQPRVLAAYDVLARAHQVFNPTLAARWLIGHEPLLGGARPLDVLAQRGAGPVIDALDAIAAGVYV